MRPPCRGDIRRRAAFWAAVALLLTILVAMASLAAAPPAGPPAAEPSPATPSPVNPSPAPASELVLTVDLDGDPVLDGIVGWERDGRVYLPVCPLAEALTLAVHCSDRRAYGFLLEESRPFLIDPDAGLLVSVRAVSRLGEAAFAEGSEVYVDAAELSRWLPVDLAVDKEGSAVHVHARELLPLQALKKRQQRRGTIVLEQPRPQYRDYSARPRLLSVPTLDLISQLQLAGQHGALQGVTRNSLQLTGDLLYLSGEAHILSENDQLQRVDLTVTKKSEAPFRIGPVPVTQLAVGAGQAPSVDGVGAGTSTLYGISVSNRPISGAARFLSHDIDGYLPAGWDAELLHNGVPVGYQPPNEEGMYHFRNLRVQYGINDFKVILHGPFGETRLSEQSFVTDSTTPKGEFLYTLSTAWQTGLTDRREPGAARESNTTFTSDFGVTEGLTGSAALVHRTDDRDSAEDFLNLGVRTAAGSTLLSLDLLQRFSRGGAGTGQLFTVRSSGRYFGDLSLESTLRFLHEFSSPQYEWESDPLVVQAVLKGNTSLAGWRGVRFPVTAALAVDRRQSGRTDCDSAWRVSGGWNGWNAALEAEFALRNGAFNSAGVLQLSTRVKETSIRGQAGFTVAPALSPSVVNLSADQEVGGGFLFNSAFSHDTAAGISALRVGFSKRLGLLGYAVSATGDSTGTYGFNVSVSTSLAADRLSSQLVVSSEPLSSYGMVAASASVAGGAGGAGKPLPKVGFLVNGGRAVTVTGTAGSPVIAYLQPEIPVDITVDLSTVEDPFMVPLEDGCHVVPRAGVVAACRFTMVTGGEIDGTVQAVLGGDSLPLKGVQVNLLREGKGGRETVASTLSEESGYYLFKAVRPGRYLVEIPQRESARLKAEPVAARAVTMPDGGDQLTGIDFLVATRRGGS